MSRYLDGTGLRQEEKSDAERVRDALRRTEILDDWWVTEDGDAIVAYVVPDRPVSHGGLLRRLRTECGDLAAAVHVVRLSALPRGPRGEVLPERLHDQPLIGDATLRLAEDAARHRGARWARAEVVDTVVPEPAVGLLTGRGTGADEPAARALDTGAARPALALGGELRHDAAAPATLGQALERAVRSRNGIVLVRGDRERVRLTYAELAQRAARVAEGLRRAGIRPGIPVMIQLADHEQFLTAFWGCQFAGMTAVPCAPPTTGTTSASEHLGGVWELLGQPPVITGHPAALPTTMAGRARILAVDALVGNTPGEPADVDPDGVAVMLLTSGSTGMPKLVTQTHAAILAMTAATEQYNALRRDDVSVNWLPLDHVVGLLMCNVRDVWLGSEQVHAPTDLVLSDPLRWLDLLSEYRATTTWAPNFAYALVNARAGEFGGRSWDLTALRSVINGGETVVAEQVRRFLELLAPFGLRDDAMWPMWGMSETCSGVTFSRTFAGTAASVVGPVEVGEPLPGLSLRVVDSAGTIMREGETGDLEVTGSMVTRGYHANDAANARSFTADGWFRTGDRAHLTNNVLTLIGRSKDIILVNGRNIPASDVETVVSRSDAVETEFTAAVAYRADGAATDGLVVLCSPRPGHDAETMIRDVRRRVLEHFGFAPARIVPVTPQEIPRTSIGKIQRSRLAAQLIAGDFDDRLGRGPAEADTDRAPLWLATPTWVLRQAGPRLRADGRSSIVLAPDATAAERLRDHLTSYGFACRTAVLPLPLSPGDGSVASTGEDVSAFLARVAIDEPPDDLIMVLGSGAEVHADTDDLVDRQTAVAERVLRVVRSLSAVASKDRPIRLSVLASQLCAVVDSDTPNPVLAPLRGLIRSLSAELPWLRARIIDVEPGHDQDAQGELLTDRFDAEVAYRAGHRWVPRLTGRHTDENPGAVSPLRSGAGYLVVGGLGGIGFELCRHLLTTRRPRLLVMGRRPVRPDDPDAALARRLRSLRRLGDVRYVAADAGDEAAVRAAVEETEESWGAPLSGALHLAGLMDGVDLAELDSARLRAVLHAKVAPAVTLARVMRERDGFVVAFSSVNAAFGGVGVAAYAAANSYLEAWSAQQDRDGVATYVLSWSRWRSLGMGSGAADEELVRSRGYRVLSPEEGLRAFEALLRLPPGRTVIGLDPRNAFILPSVDGATVALDRVDVRCDPLPDEPDLQISDVVGRPLTVRAVAGSAGELPADPQDATVLAIARIWQEVLGVAQIPYQEGFFEMGAKSLHLPRVQHLVEEQLAARIDVADLFRYPTVRDLAAHVDRLRGRAARPAVEQHDRDGGTRRVAAGRFSRLRAAREGRLG